MFKAIRAIGIYVTDMERAKDFYVNKLGFTLGTEISPDECILYIESSSIAIFLSRTDKPSVTDEKGPRITVFFHADEYARKVYSLLKARGVKLLQDAPQKLGENMLWFQLSDPDGNIIEVMAEP